MIKLFAFRNEDLQTRPFGLVGALVVFLIVFGIDLGVGVVYMTISMLLFEGQAVTQSVIMNVGSWIAKVLTVVVLYQTYVFQSHPVHMGRYRKRMSRILNQPIESDEVNQAVNEVLKPPFYGLIDPIRLLKIIPALLLLVIFYRVGYDSLIGSFVSETFPMDEEILESFEAIFAVPALGLIYVAFMAPIFEEIFFRGFMMNGMRRYGYQAWVAILISSVLFAVIHMNVAQGVNALLIGLLCGYLYERTGDLRAPIALHFINNILAVTMMEPYTMWLDGQATWMRLLATLLGILMVGLIVAWVHKETETIEIEESEIIA